MLSCADLMSVRSKCVSNWRGETALCVRACVRVNLHLFVCVIVCVCSRACVRACGCILSEALAWMEGRRVGVISHVSSHGMLLYMLGVVYPLVSPSSA